MKIVWGKLWNKRLLSYREKFSWAEHQSLLTIWVDGKWMDMKYLCKRTYFRLNKGPQPNSGVRPDWGRPGRLVGGAGSGILRAKSWNKVYSMCRYPFMNNNGCQNCFILLPNLLVWIEIINIQKLVTHVTNCFPGV